MSIRNYLQNMLGKINTKKNSVLSNTQFHDNVKS